jgi:hypothetical protein
MNRVMALVAAVAGYLPEDGRRHVIRVRYWGIEKCGVECPKRARLREHMVVKLLNVLANTVARQPCCQCGAAVIEN